MKSKMGTKEPKKRRCNRQWFSEPSPTNALRAAPCKPHAQAASARIGANAGHVRREASTLRRPTCGGW